MIPLAWALRAAGHEVLIATAEAGLVADDAGLPVVDVAPGLDLRAVMRQRMAEMPESEREQIAQQMTKGFTDLATMLPRMTMITTVLVDGVLRLAEQWRPDLVVQSGLQAAGLIAAAKLGVPVVDHGFGFTRSTGQHKQWRENLAETFDWYGVGALPERTASLDVAPPSMLTGPPLGWPMRYVPYNGGGVLPCWLFDRSDRPLIAVTLGTVAPGMTGLGPVERIIELASEVDADFVAALGSADISSLGPLPANVRVTGWLPLNALLRVSSALVHHGGSGSTLGALAAGVPQLALPSGADRFINAKAVHDGGAGLSADESDLDAALLNQLLDDEKLRDTAAAVSEEIAGLPSPASIAEKLVALAR
jgi:UDP:flavonoid glycosyltransferase YjiC (YdhE family)